MRLGVTSPISGLLAALAMSVATASSAAGYHTEYVFTAGSDGGWPVSPPIYYRGKLYGAATRGGANGLGAIYSFDPKTGVQATAHSFKGGSDGAAPRSTLTKLGGVFYGTTAVGGASDLGTIFSFDPSTGQETVLYAFKGGNDGALPGSLLDVGGIFYGTTIAGGGFTSVNCVGVGGSCGTVFSFSPATGVETVIHAFTGGADGGSYGSGLVEIGGRLYGTGAYGTNYVCFNRCGMVFSIDPTNGAEAVVYSFKGSDDGDKPYGLMAIGSILYGETWEGGVTCTESDLGCGTVYSLDTSTGAKTVLYDFKGGSDGASPAGDLTEVGGVLYGTTTSGGRGRGTVYSLNLATGVETVVHAFHGAAQGRFPNGGLLELRGKLWGTTYEGGGSLNCGKPGCGTLFDVIP